MLWDEAARYACEMRPHVTKRGRMLVNVYLVFNLFLYKRSTGI